VAETKFLVALAESKTGKILTSDGKRYQHIGESWLAFNSLREAETFAKEQVESNPEIECVILTQNKKPVAVARNIYGVVKFTL